MKIPYGKGFLEASVPDENLLGVVHSRDADRVENLDLAFSRIDALIGRLSSLKGLTRKSRATILVTDSTRATPNKAILPPLLEAVEKRISGENITILVANGLHKPLPERELEELLGDVVRRYEALNHDAEKPEDQVFVGGTSFGTRVYVNRLVPESDLVIGTGLIEPHFFAGYSGGRKIILPGVAAKQSIYDNHSFKMIDHPLARYGVLDGNPIHEDMVEAVRMCKLDFIVNAVIDKHRRLLKLFYGDPLEAHAEGVRFLDEMVRVKAGRRADIVITSNGGYPLDRNLYQAVKGMATGDLLVRKNGVIVMVAECVDGVGRGHGTFYRLMAEAKSPEDVLERIRREEPIKDQWEAQYLARILKHAKVIVVTRNIKPSVVEEMHMMHASELQEAVEMAFREAGRGAKVSVVPEGPYVIPEAG